MNLIPSSEPNNIDVYKPSEIEIKLTQDNKCIIQSKHEPQTDQQNLICNDNLINLSFTQTSICETTNGKIPINTNDYLLISFSNVSELTKTNNNYSIINTSTIDKDNNTLCNYDTENNNTNPSKTTNVNEIYKNNDIYKNYIFSILNSDKKTTPLKKSKSQCSKKNSMKKYNFKVEKLENVDISKNKIGEFYIKKNMKMFNIENIDNLQITSTNNNQVKDKNENIKLNKEKIKHLSSFSFGLNNFNLLPSSNSSSVKSNNINNPNNLNTYVSPKNNLNNKDLNKYFQANNNEENNLYLSPKFNEEIINQSDKIKDKKNEKTSNDEIKENKEINFTKNDRISNLKIEKNLNNFSIINPKNNNLDDKVTHNNYIINRNNIFNIIQESTKNSKRKIQSINLIKKQSMKKLYSVGKLICESERTKNNDNIKLTTNDTTPQTKLTKYIVNSKSKKSLKNKLKNENSSNTDTVVHLKIKNKKKITIPKLLHLKINSNYNNSICKNNKVKLIKPSNNIKKNKLLRYCGSSKCYNKNLHISKNNSFNKINPPKLKIVNLAQNKQNIKTKGNIDQSLKVRLQNIIKKNINKMKSNCEIALEKEDSTKNKNNTNSTNNNTYNSNSSSNCKNNLKIKSNSAQRSNSKKLKMIQKNRNSQRSENKKLNPDHIFTHNTVKTNNIKPRIENFLSCKNNSNLNLNLRNSRKKQLVGGKNLYENNNNTVNNENHNKIRNFSLESGENENITKNNSSKNFINKNLNNMKMNIYNQNGLKNVNNKDAIKNSFNENNSNINSSIVNGYKRPKAVIQNFSNYKRKNELNETESNASKKINEEKNYLNFLQNTDGCSHGNQNVANKNSFSLGEKYHTNEY